MGAQSSNGWYCPSHKTIPKLWDSGALFVFCGCISQPCCDFRLGLDLGTPLPHFSAPPLLSWVPSVPGNQMWHHGVGKNHGIIGVKKNRELRMSPYNSLDLAKSSTKRWSETPRGGEIQFEGTVPFPTSHLLPGSCCIANSFSL